jgi:2-polyprenyl-6-methoxyphenol hydroxylase-like FAD-dependent oxidoreductase
VPDTVLIAGGGPAGLMLAGELALAGVPAIVLERETSPAEASPGMAVHGRTLELFKRRGLTDGIGPSDMFPWPRTPFALMWLDMDGAREEDYTYAFPQWRTERLLEKWATGLGADIRRGHELVEFTQHDDRVTATVRTRDGSVYALNASWFAAFDGARSRVRELAGIGAERIGPDYYGVLGDMRLGDDADRNFDAGLHPDGMFGAIPLSADTVRLMTIEFDVEAPPADAPVTAAELAARIERITGNAPRLGELSFLARFGAPTVLAEQFRSGRVFLLGDAAHSMFISGTQGLNAGLHDAANLGWKLAAVASGRAPEALLDSYETERRPVAAQACWHASATMALLHPLQRVERLRELITVLFGFDDVNRYLLEVTTAARYPLPAGDSASGSLLGLPVPNATLHSPDGETTIATVMHESRGKGLLLDLSGGVADLGDMGAWSDRVAVKRAEPIPELQAAVLLIRPDGHIAHADSTGTDISGLTETLRSWFGAPAFSLNSV